MFITTVTTFLKKSGSVNSFGILYLLKKTQPSLYKLQLCQITHDNSLVAVKQKWFPLYKPIILIAGLSRLKIYHIPLSMIVLQITMMCTVAETMNLETFLSITVTNAILMAHTALVSWLSYRWTGIIYINEDATTVKISYVNLKGDRIDEEFNSNDFIPLQNNKNHYRDYLFSVIKLKNRQEYFKINFRFGILRDEELFKNIFGEIPLNSGY